jgi:outer membrane lipoprotein-sorting protein
MKRLPWILLFLLQTALAAAEFPAGEDVLKKVDENLVFDQAITESEMVIHGRSGTRRILSRGWARGSDEALVEYLAPPREKGKKMLKLADRIWIYSPEPQDRIIAISGHLLRQSVMGSDLSYEDITENDTLKDLYEAVTVGEEVIQDRHCWVLTLTGKHGGLTYAFRKIWVDSKRWVPLKEDRYAKSGKLLKTTLVEEVFQTGGRWYPKKVRFKDMLSTGQGTEYILHAMDFNVEIPEDRFTKAALRK